jgi:transposase-like protein
MKPSKTEARWRRLIAEQEHSGRSVREFAEEKGVSAWSLYGWRSRLGVAGGRGRGRTARRRDGDEVELVAVDVVGAQAVTATEPQLVIELNDVRVRVARGFDAECGVPE